MGDDGDVNLAVGVTAHADIDRSQIAVSVNDDVEADLNAPLTAALGLAEVPNLRGAGGTRASSPHGRRWAPGLPRPRACPRRSAHSGAGRSPDSRKRDALRRLAGLRRRVSVREFGSSRFVVPRGTRSTARGPGAPPNPGPLATHTGRWKTGERSTLVSPPTPLVSRCCPAQVRFQRCFSSSRSPLSAAARGAFVLLRRSGVFRCSTWNQSDRGEARRPAGPVATRACRWPAAAAPSSRAAGSPASPAA